MAKQIDLQPPATKFCSESHAKMNFRTGTNYLSIDLMSNTFRQCAQDRTWRRGREARADRGGVINVRCRS